MALMFWGDFCLFQPLKSPKASWLLEEFVLGGHWDRPGAGLIPSARTKRTPPPSFSRHLSPVEQQPWGGLWPKDLISPSSRYLILSYLLPQNRSRGSYWKGAQNVAEELGLRLQLLVRFFDEHSSAWLGAGGICLTRPESPSDHLDFPAWDAKWHILANIGGLLGTGWLWLFGEKLGVKSSRHRPLRNRRGGRSQSGVNSSPGARVCCHYYCTITNV